VLDNENFIRINNMDALIAFDTEEIAEKERSLFQPWFIHK
jgi:hypothetical protein